jgi:hypothetical protein
MRMLTAWNEAALKRAEESQRQLVPIAMIVFSVLLLGSIFAEPWLAVVILAIVLGGIICASIIHIVQS